MARFTFVAEDKYKNITRGDVDAKNREDALNILARRGLSPIKLDQSEADATSGKFARFNASLSFGGKLTIFDQITIIRHLGTILNTGSDILGGLETIAQDAIKPIVKKILLDVKTRILRGESFSDALRHWQDNFNPVFISLVKAGEASGTLPNILLTYAQELRKDYTFNSKLKNALVYPAILFLGLIAMITLMLTFVIPRLKELFSSTNSNPPIYTKLFFTASDLFNAHLFGVLIGTIVLGVFFVIGLRNKTMRRHFSFVTAYIPIINKAQKNIMLARFTKTVARLIDAGFTLKASLLIAAEIINPRYQKAVIQIAEEKLERGIPFSQTLAQYPKFFPKILVSVIATGERSGQLSSVLVQMSEFYEEEVIYSLELILTLIEPAILIIVGGVILLMAFSIISPLYNLISASQFHK